MTTQRKGSDAVDGEPAPLLRIEDVAGRLSVSRSMAWKLVAQGELRSLRIGRAVRIRPSDLEAYLDSIVRES